MQVTAYPLSFLERRTLVFFFTIFFYSAWSIALGVNLAIKLRTEGIDANEIRALIFAEAVACACSASLFVGAILQQLAKLRGTGYWLTSVQGEVIWILGLCPFTLFSAVTTSISRPFFKCPGVTNPVQLSSCNGANNGILFIGWLFPILVFSYLILILSRARKLAKIYEPFVREQVWKAKWDDVAYYQRLRSLQRLNGYDSATSRTSGDSSDYDAESGAWRGGEPLPRYEPKDQEANIAAQHAAMTAAIANTGRMRNLVLPETLAPSKPVKPLLMRQVNNPTSSANLPQYQDLYPTRTQGLRPSRPGPWGVLASRPVLIREIPREDTFSVNHPPRLSVLGQELTVPKDFRHVPVPTLQFPPPIAKKPARVEENSENVAIHREYNKPSNDTKNTSGTTVWQRPVVNGRSGVKEYTLSTKPQVLQVRN